MAASKTAMDCPKMWSCVDTIDGHHSAWSLIVYDSLMFVCQIDKLTISSNLTIFDLDIAESSNRSVVALGYGSGSGQAWKDGRSFRSRRANKVHRSWASEICALRSWASAQFAAAWLLTAVGLFADGFGNKQNFRIFSDISDSLLQVTRPSFISAFTPGCAPSTPRVQGTALRRAQRNSVGRKKRELPASLLQVGGSWDNFGDSRK